MRFSRHLVVDLAVLTSVMACLVGASPVFLTEFKLTPAQPGADIASEVQSFLASLGLHFALSNITVTAVG